MESQKKAYFYVCVPVIFWSTVASVFKVSLRYLDVVCLVFYSAVVSAVVLFFYILFSGRLRLLRAFSREDYLRSALLGFLNPFLYYVILLKAYSILPAQEAQPLNFVWPIVLVLLSIPILKQKVGLRSIFAIVISFTGVFVIATRGRILDFRLSDATGVSLALGSTVVWALFWIYNVRDKRDEGVRLFLNFAFGSLYAFVAFFFMLLFGKSTGASAGGFLGAAYVGLFEMGITFLVWLKALKLSKTTAHVASLIYLVPFLSLVVISVAVPEKILGSTIIGAVLIVSGIILHKLWASAG